MTRTATFKGSVRLRTRSTPAVTPVEVPMELCTWCRRELTKRKHSCRQSKIAEARWAALVSEGE